MKKTESKDILSRVKIISIILIIVCIALVQVGLISKRNKFEKYILTKDVVVKHNGKKVFEGDVNKYKLKNVKSEDIFVVYMKIPDVTMENATIKYDNVNTAVTVYQDGKEIYSIGKKTPKTGVVCHAFNKVPLKNIKKGQEIEMHIRVVNGAGLSLLPTVELMNAKDSDLDYFYSMLVFIIIDVYLFLMGIIGVLLASYSRNKDTISKRLMALSVCNIVCGLYFISLYQVIPLFSDNYLLDAYCEYITTIGAVLTLNIYMFFANPKGMKKLSLILTILSSIHLVVVVTSQVLRIKAFNDFTYIFTILCIATVINFFITYAKNLKNVMNKKLFVFGVYCVLIILLVYFGVAIFFKHYKPVFLIALPIAILIVLTLEFIELIYEIIKELVTRAEKQALVEMAYIDRFTGLLNRRGLDKKINEISKGKYDVCLFDINGLKKVNDEYGHLVGDQLIKDFVKELLVVFQEDYCARTGGDEFVVMCNEKKNVQEKLKKLRQNIDNIKGKQYKVDYAVGYAKYNTLDNNIGEVIKEADSMMYEMKNSRKKA